ncbi:mCG147538 [Mus musculus]|nr:mCG147538 [Mus musculus]
MAGENCQEADSQWQKGSGRVNYQDNVMDALSPSSYRRLFGIKNWVFSSSALQAQERIQPFPLPLS